MTIRPATSGNAPALATAQVRGWQWTYQGQVPDAYLEQLGQTPGKRISARRTQWGLHRLLNGD